MLLSSLENKLKNSKNILLIGIGGGFDFLQGVPVYEKLHNLGKNIVWANLSFSDVHILDEYNKFVIVDAYTKNIPVSKYFPEKYLCEWYLKEHDRYLSIYTFPRFGPKIIKEIVGMIISEHSVDLIICIDGGTDSLMRGDEPELGTPEEDLSTLCALSFHKNIEQLLITTVFGVDHYHGVQHYYFLKAVSELSRKNGFFGVESLLPNSIEADVYNRILDYVHSKMQSYKSIVSSCLKESLQSNFGDIKLSVEPRNAVSFISPLTNMYWYFDAKKVASRCLYINDISDLKLYPEVTEAIKRFRNRIIIQPSMSIKG